jgi:hypothetical protein
VKNKVASAAVSENLGMAAAAPKATLAASADCATCGRPGLAPGATAGFASVYQPVCAVGQLTAQIPSIAVDKELAQLTAGEHQGDQIKVELLQRVLSDQGNAYLGWYLSWVFTSGGTDAFTVVPRSDADVARLAEVLSAGPEEVVHVIVGKAVPIPADSPSALSGLPAVQADQVLAFTLREFAEAMPYGEESDRAAPETGRHEFEDLVSEVFLRLTKGAALPGFADVDRGRAYIAYKYSAFYHAVGRARREGKVLTGVYARHSHSSGRQVVSVGFDVRDRQSDLHERFECRVDVTQPLIFLADGLRLVYE